MTADWSPVLCRQSGDNDCPAALPTPARADSHSSSESSGGFFFFFSIKAQNLAIHMKSLTLNSFLFLFHLAQKTVWFGYDVSVHASFAVLGPVMFPLVPHCPFLVFSNRPSVYTSSMHRSIVPICDICLASPRSSRSLPPFRTLLPLTQPSTFK